MRESELASFRSGGESEFPGQQAASVAVPVPVVSSTGPESERETPVAADPPDQMGTANHDQIGTGLESRPLLRPIVGLKKGTTEAASVGIDIPHQIDTGEERLLASVGIDRAKRIEKDTKSLTQVAAGIVTFGVTLLQAQPSETVKDSARLQMGFVTFFCAAVIASLLSAMALAILFFNRCGATTPCNGHLIYIRILVSIAAFFAMIALMTFPFFTNWYILLHQPPI